MKLNDFLKVELLGSKFVAIKGYEEVFDRNTQQHVAYRINVSIQDENSDFYMELIPVKVRTISPTIKFETMKNNKATPIILKNLVIGQFNGNLWFSCEDILPASK